MPTIEKSKLKRTHVHLYPNELERLKLYAAYQQIPAAQVIRQAIKDYLTKVSQPISN